MSNSDIRTVDFNLLATFDAIYEHRQITRAAQHLNVSQSTASGTLARLREVFGDPLFVRTASGMSPTGRAESLAPHIKKLMAEMNGLLKPAAFNPATAAFTARISANDYGQTVVLAPLIRRLSRTAEGVRFSVTRFETVELGDKFRSGHVDLAITIPEMAPQDYPSRFLFSDRYVGVIRSDNDLTPADADTIDLDTFCSLGQILVSPTDGAMVSPTDTRLREIGRKRRVAVAVPAFRMALDLVRTTDYLAVLPERFIRPDDTSIRMVELPIDLRGPDAIVVWHPRVHDDPAFQWLRAEIGRSVADETKS